MRNSTQLGQLMHTFTTKPRQTIQTSDLDVWGSGATRWTTVHRQNRKTKHSHHPQQNGQKCMYRDIPTFSYLANPPMTAGSTIPLSNMDRGLMGRTSSPWYWFIIVRIFSLVVSIVSMAFSNGLIVVWGKTNRLSCYSSRRCGQNNFMHITRKFQFDYLLTIIHMFLFLSQFLSAYHTSHKYIYFRLNQNSNWPRVRHVDPWPEWQY